MAQVHGKAGVSRDYAGRVASAASPRPADRGRGLTNHDGTQAPAPAKPGHLVSGRLVSSQLVSGRDRMQARHRLRHAFIDIDIIFRHAAGSETAIEGRPHPGSA